MPAIAPSQQARSAYFEELESSLRSHALFRTPFLSALAAGAPGLGRLQFFVEQFALQAASLPGVVTQALLNAGDEGIASAVVRTLADESALEAVSGRSGALLLRRFVVAAGVTPEQLGLVEPVAEARALRTAQIALARESHPLETVGLLLALEGGDAILMPELAAGLTMLGFDDDALAFFAHRAERGRAHFESIRNAAAAGVDTPVGRSYLYTGSQRALDALDRFWARLHHECFQIRPAATEKSAMLAA
jgi:pyrroloquinoline quinone (PQQ) biosynthesis protein C